MAKRDPRPKEVIERARKWAEMMSRHQCEICGMRKATLRYLGSAARFFQKKPFPDRLMYFCPDCWIELSPLISVLQEIYQTADNIRRVCNVRKWKRQR
jgi:hypothetical protein